MVLISTRYVNVYIHQVICYKSNFVMCNTIMFFPIHILADKENIEGYAREKLNKKFFQIMLGKFQLIILTIEYQDIKI